MLRIIFRDHSLGELHIISLKDRIKIRHIGVRIRTNDNCLTSCFQIINDFLGIRLIKILLRRINDNCRSIIRNALLIEKFNAGQRHVCLFYSGLEFASECTLIMSRNLIDYRQIIRFHRYIFNSRCKLSLCIKANQIICIRIA